MKRHLPALILVLTVFCCKSFAQLPPQLVSYTDSPSTYYIDLYINYVPNDTGTIKAQVQLEQGSGNVVYDSIFVLPSGATTARLHVGPIFPCSYYSSLLFGMSNDSAYGTVNSLFAFSTLCNTGIKELNEGSFFVSVLNHGLEIHASEIPENGIAEIYDLQGRKITSFNLTQSVQTVNMNAGAGIYFLRISDSNQTLYTNRFVLN
jgi:hypothetical protein